MLKFPVNIKKQENLFKQMQKLQIEEKNIEEKFVKAGGKGGQKVNKSNTAVLLKYLAEDLDIDIEVKCSHYRSQALNRYQARKLLCERVEQMTLGKESSLEKKREKIRKQKAVRKRRNKRDSN